MRNDTQRNIEESLVEINDYVDSDIKDIPVQEEEQLTPPCATQPPTSTLEDSLAYQFEMTNTRFNVVEERLVHFRSRTTIMGKVYPKCNGTRSNSYTMCNLILITQLIYISYTTLKDPMVSMMTP